jgi:hypothetical protein
MKLTGGLLIAALVAGAGCSGPSHSVVRVTHVQSEINPPPEWTAPAYSYELIPLKLYWNGRSDNLTTASPLGQQESVAGYQFVRTEGYVFTKMQGGTVPLKQYWSIERGEYQLTMTAQAEREAVAAGYRFVRVEGYAYPTWQPGAVPLKLFWNPDRQDNFTLATLAAGLDATNGGYHFVRIEGYVLPSSQ